MPTPSGKPVTDDSELATNPLRPRAFGEWGAEGMNLIPLPFSS